MSRRGIMIALMFGLIVFGFAGCCVMMSCKSCW
jgi:hypothetical protein